MAYYNTKLLTGMSITKVNTIEAQDESLQAPQKEKAVTRQN